MTPSDRLAEVSAMLTAVNDSILKLCAKTNSSVTFGDQSYTITDVEKLMKIRNLLRQEQDALEAKISGLKRRTIKIAFPAN